jgi:hypothetical protein
MTKKFTMAITLIAALAAGVSAGNRLNDMKSTGRLNDVKTSDVKSEIDEKFPDPEYASTALMNTTICRNEAEQITVSAIYVGDDPASRFWSFRVLQNGRWTDLDTHKGGVHDGKGTSDITAEEPDGTVLAITRRTDEESREWSKQATLTVDYKDVSLDSVPVICE